MSDQQRISYAQACQWGATAIDEDIQKYASSRYGEGIVAAADRQAAALRQLASIAERAEKKVSSYKHNEALVRSLGDGLGLQQEHEQFAVRLLTELAAGFAPIAPSPVPGVPAHAGEVGNR